VKSYYFISKLIKEIKIVIVISQKVVGIEANAKLVVNAYKAQKLLRGISKAGSGQILYRYGSATAIRNLSKLVKRFLRIREFIRSAFGGNRLSAGVNDKFIYSRVGYLFYYFRIQINRKSANVVAACGYLYFRKWGKGQMVRPQRNTVAVGKHADLLTILFFMVIEASYYLDSVNTRILKRGEILVCKGKAAA
jgi:hypothetical protein